MTTNDPNSIDLFPGATRISEAPLSEEQLYLKCSLILAKVDGSLALDDDLCVETSVTEEQVNAIVEAATAAGIYADAADDDFSKEALYRVQFFASAADYQSAYDDCNGEA